MIVVASNFPFPCSYWRDPDICLPINASFSFKWRMVTSLFWMHYFQNFSLVLVNTHHSYKYA